MQWEKYEHIKHTIQIESNTEVCERKSAAVLQNVCGLKKYFLAYLMSRKTE